MKPTGGVGGGFGQTGFSETERKRIDANLRKPLGPEYLATRAGPGGAKLSYIEGHRVISLAQEIFGFDGWSHSIVQTDIDFVDTARDGTAYSIGVSTIVRVTLKDGTSHEDVGYGYIENAKSKGMAFEKAKKESVTDGIKRALKSFGNALGNCVYDKRILMNIGKVPKVAPITFTEAHVYRGSEFDVSLWNGNGAVNAGPPNNTSGCNTAGMVHGNGTKMEDAGDEFDNMIFPGDVESFDPAMLRDVSNTNLGPVSALQLGQPPAGAQAPASITNNISRPGQTVQGSSNYAKPVAPVPNKTPLKASAHQIPGIPQQQNHSHHQHSHPALKNNVSASLSGIVRPHAAAAAVSQRPNMPNPALMPNSRLPSNNTTGGPNVSANVNQPQHLSNLNGPNAHSSNMNNSANSRITLPHPGHAGPAPAPFPPSANMNKGGPPLPNPVLGSVQHQQNAVTGPPGMQQRSHSNPGGAPMNVPMQQQQAGSSNGALQHQKRPLQSDTSLNIINQQTNGGAGVSVGLSRNGSGHGGAGGAIPGAGIVGGSAPYQYASNQVKKQKT